MSTEIEIKLSITTADIPKLLQHAIILQYSQQDTIHSLRNTYFDTQNLDLSQRNCTLRIRELDNQFLQTLKCGNSSSSDYKERQEYEYPINQSEFEIDKFPKTIQNWLSKYITQIEPMFVSEFQRHTWQLFLYDNTHIELALDQGKITADDCSVPISEVELELKSGNINTLKLIAKQLQTDLSLQTGTQSKANRGFQLRQYCRDKKC